jgi:hypothetical protein
MLLPDRRHADSQPDPQPIWLAALLASACHALGRNGARKVEWQCVPDAAMYTNTGDDVEILLPFGVSVRGGQTVVVTWLPGDTAYTLRLVETAYLAA